MALSVFASSLTMVQKFVEIFIQLAGIAECLVMLWISVALSGHEDGQYVLQVTLKY
jgi:hypothetical protein